jgi:hypothetical protein
MFKSMFNTFCKIITESLQDNATGRYSSARVIAMLVAIAATVFMWKLVILGGMSIDYFVAYLAYGTGTASLNKFLDNKDTSRAEQAKAALAKSPVVEDEPPKPPKD